MAIDTFDKLFNHSLSDLFSIYIINFIAQICFYFSVILKLQVPFCVTVWRYVFDLNYFITIKCIKYFKFHRKLSFIFSTIFRMEKPHHFFF